MAQQLIVSYLRVSTQKQGIQGLGIDAQRAAVNGYVARTGAFLLAEYCETESGRKTDQHRPMLKRALLDARTRGATLVIAKLDRLSRNAEFLLHLMNSGVDFAALDLPGANRLTVQILACVAEDE